MKVLVVDDEQLVRWFLERALKKWGHDVVSVSNTKEAMQHIDTQPFDVMFTDLRMPGGNGANLVKSLSEKPDKDMRIVICSAFITPEMVMDFSDRGILTLKKPFKLSELESTLKQVNA